MDPEWRTGPTAGAFLRFRITDRIGFQPVSFYVVANVMLLFSTLRSTSRWKTAATSTTVSRQRTSRSPSARACRDGAGSWQRASTWVSAILRNQSSRWIERRGAEGSRFSRASGSERTMARLACLLVLTSLVACGADSPTSPDPTGAPLSRTVATAHYVFHFTEQDRVDETRQEAFHDWVLPQLGVSPSRQIQYFKYLDRAHMQRATGRAANGGPIRRNSPCTRSFPGMRTKPFTC